MLVVSSAGAEPPFLCRKVCFDDLTSDNMHVERYWVQLELLPVRLAESIT